jgi:hypothetical protein
VTGTTLGGETGVVVVTASDDLPGDGPFELRIRTSPAIQLSTGDAFTIEGNTQQATEVWTRPDDECAAGTRRVYYHYVYIENDTDEAVVIDVDTNGSSFDTYLHLFGFTFDPDRPHLNCNAGDDDGGNGRASLISGYTINAGRARFIVVSGFGENTRGDWILNVRAR